MSFLVTFPDGYDTLCATREAAEKMLSYWGHIKPTIRHLDQEAKDREEMIAVLLRVELDGEDNESKPGACWECDQSGDREPGLGPCFHQMARALLKRLGRLP